MYTALEEALIKSALDDKASHFFSLLEILKKEHNANIPAEKLKELFCNEKMNLLATLVANVTIAENSEAEKIVLGILNELEGTGIHWQKLLLGEGIAYDDQNDQLVESPLMPLEIFYLSEWAFKHSTSKIVAHPFVQQAMHAKQIIDLWKSGDFAGGEAILENMKSNNALDAREIALVFCSLFPNTNMKDLENDPEKLTVVDMVFSKLLDRGWVSLKEIIIFNPRGPFMINAPIYEYGALYQRVLGRKFEAVESTKAFRAYYDAAHLTKEGEHLVALNSIPKYLNSIESKQFRSEVAAEIFCESRFPIDEDSIKVLKLLLGSSPIFKESDEVLFIYFYLYKCYELDKTIMAHPSLLSAFSQIGDQRSILQSVFINQSFGWFSSYILNLPNCPLFVRQFFNLNAALKYYSHPVCIPIPAAFQRPFPAPDDKSFQALYALYCKHAKPCLTIYDLVFLINTIVVDPADPNYALRKQYVDFNTKNCQALLQYNLVKDIYSLTPGMFHLKFNDPKTNQPYDLFKYIHDNPVLYAGYMSPGRKKELLDQYAVIKAVLADDPRTQAELAKVDKEVKSAKVWGDGQKHSMTKIFSFMRENADVALDIISRISSSAPDNTDEKRVTNRLTNIALEEKEKRGPKKT